MQPRPGDNNEPLEACSSESARAPWRPAPCQASASVSDSGSSPVMRSSAEEREQQVAALATIAKAINSQQQQQRQMQESGQLPTLQQLQRQLQDRRNLSAAVAAVRQQQRQQREKSAAQPGPVPVRAAQTGACEPRTKQTSASGTTERTFAPASEQKSQNSQTFSSPPPNRIDSFALPAARGQPTSTTTSTTSQDKERFLQHLQTPATSERRQTTEANNDNIGEQVPTAGCVQRTVSAGKQTTTNILETVVLDNHQQPNHLQHHHQQQLQHSLSRSPRTTAAGHLQTNISEPANEFADLEYAAGQARSNINDTMIDPLKSPNRPGAQARLSHQENRQFLTSTPTAAIKSIRDELTIQTGPINPSVRSLTLGPNTNHHPSSELSSAQSTPSNSVLSDSTTLITEAAMNSSELIPKLIERLDRKLIVMKEEQLTLMREVELNEATGQRLFESLQRHLTPSESEKITLHANEIEKVTKLILSLKLRLKRVESELKERGGHANANISHKQANNFKSTPDRYHHKHQQQIEHNNKQTNASHRDQESSQLDRHSRSSASIYATNKSSKPSLRVHDDDDMIRGGTNGSNHQPLTVRGVSDPTSTIGLPKRNHQHHASLQSASQTDRNNESMPSAAVTPPRLLAIGGTAASCKLDFIDSVDLTKSRSMKQQTHHSQSGGQADDGPAQQTTSSASNDSIFNCADSAIGSTITGHGGSATNIEQPATSQSSLTSASSASSTRSSLTSTSSRNHDSNSPSQRSHISSTISVSSHSSMSSVPNSPPLMSPPSSATSMTTATAGGGFTAQKGCVTTGAHHDSKGFTMASALDHQANNVSLNGSLSVSAFFRSDANNNSNNSLNNSTLTNDLSESMANLLTDIDILFAKRNKLVSQLEEAHQLEECIVRRNTVIVERILKKYFDETSSEISEFKQFTRLKSLLLKDSHDVADRIDNAELQLTELKQSNSTAI